MDIAIPVLAKTLPDVRNIAAALKHFRPLDARHRIVVFTTASLLKDAEAIFDGLRDVTFRPILSTIYREAPRVANETFDVIAREMTRNHWFYLTNDTRPVSPDWADVLDQKYRESGKRYFGRQANLVRRYRDASGVDRVDLGDAYILEAAIYPANLTKIEKITARNHGTHHEVFRRFEMAKNSATTDLIGSNEWQTEFTHRSGQVVVTRVFGPAVDDFILDLEAGGADEPEGDSDDVVDAGQKSLTLDPVKRGRGRPRKVPALS